VGRTRVRKATAQPNRQPLASNPTDEIVLKNFTSSFFRFPFYQLSIPEITAQTSRRRTCEEPVVSNNLLGGESGRRSQNCVPSDSDPPRRRPDDGASVWDVISGQHVTHLNHEGPRDLAFSSEGDYLATVGTDKITKIWRGSDYAAVGRIPNTTDMHRVALAPGFVELATLVLSRQRSTASARLSPSATAARQSRMTNG
jgi:hypothetical protein